MLLKSDISNILHNQYNTFSTKNYGLIRELKKTIIEQSFSSLIITGIKYSGKSTLLFQLFKEKFTDALYINFEHPRFYNFDLNDLFKLDEIIEEKNSKILFFDEVQKLKGWNNYVIQKLEEGFQIIIASSDNSVFDNESELGYGELVSKKELFPFSLSEFCAFQEIEKNGKAVEKYIENGGFPGSYNSNSEEYLNQLFDDLLVRGIAMRNGIRDLRSFKRLAIHLLSNIGKFITGYQLKTQLGIRTTNTVMEYLSYFEAGFLFFYVPKFSYSIRKQIVNPRKVYTIDTGLVTANSTKFEDYTEQLLENMVFLHLRKQVPELYYFSENYNCDFVIMKKNRVENVVQVCDELKHDNLETELNGLFEAMDFFELHEGTIVTLSQSDRFERNGKIVNVVPVYLFV